MILGSCRCYILLPCRWLGATRKKSVWPSGPEGSGNAWPWSWLQTSDCYGGWPGGSGQQLKTRQAAVVFVQQNHWQPFEVVKPQGCPTFGKGSFAKSWLLQQLGPSSAPDALSKAENTKNLPCSLFGSCYYVYLNLLELFWQPPSLSKNVLLKSWNHTICHPKSAQNSQWFHRCFASVQGAARTSPRRSHWRSHGPGEKQELCERTLWKLRSGDLTGRGNWLEKSVWKNDPKNR